MITKAIRNAFRQLEEKNWDKTYWAFDIHETMIKPNWSEKEIPTEFYPMAKETMNLISERSDIVRILYTCSHPKEIDNYLDYFKSNGIYFDYVNKNPEVINKKYGFYDHKPYFNVLFEDKSGFDPYEDWHKVYHLLSEFE